MTQKDPAIVCVEWNDAYTGVGWRDPADPNLHPCCIKTVGYLVKLSKDSVIVTTSISQDLDAVADPLVIPKGCITKMKRLHLKTSREK